MWSETQMIPCQKGNLSSLEQSSLKRPLVMADSIYLNYLVAKTKSSHFPLLAWPRVKFILQIPSFFFSFFFFLFLSSCEQWLTIPVLVLWRWWCDSGVSVPALSQSRHAGTHDMLAPCHLTGFQVAEMCISSMSFNNWGAKAVKYQALPTRPLLCQIKP